MAEMRVTNLKIDELQLDKNNPRIAAYVEQYGENLTAEAIAFALDDSGSSGTSFAALRDAIKRNGGLIQPIIVNHANGVYTAIEGNTRLKIYQEFNEQGVEGHWDTIPCIVYENMTDLEMHTTRLQAHMVGPREWSRYAKAKYLHALSTDAGLTESQILDSCGGIAKRNEIRKMIQAYSDMEKYYRPKLESDDEFDPRSFSHFEEMEKRTFLKTLLSFELGKDDFAEWVIAGKIPRAQSVRDIPSILQNKQARELFLSAGATTDDAMKIVHATEIGSGSEQIDSASIASLARALCNRLTSMTRIEAKDLAANPNGQTVRELRILSDWIQDIMDDIPDDEENEEEE